MAIDSDTVAQSPAHRLVAIAVSFAFAGCASMLLSQRRGNASGGLKLIHFGGEELIRPYVQGSPVYFFRPFSGRAAAEGASTG
jgi:hypothetical protein